jgi:hypothetical protein
MLDYQRNCCGENADGSACPARKRAIGLHRAPKHAKGAQCRIPEANGREAMSRESSRLSSGLDRRDQS